ncbi:BTB domain-containing protein [Mycena indigotica]|uniref:BTB domain-containing protein n=1 Tax=Mycena indigotica TaxID=2126181 RepID=A0A8H6SGU7_9AGAR|nr:BTB domain-containing protein [Mycena indigotica]KAF7299345.1 BTB domain-containing protein [Mycena indigotica]
MSSADHPAKRPRLADDDSNIPTPAISRSQEFWFNDGSVILQVENTQFRVAQSLLAMHSSVFRDMFTIPLPPEEPLVEGCPVVVLSGDKAVDWSHLLRAVYPSRCDFFSPDKKDIHAFAAVFRLSKKYDFTVFRRECLQCFKAEFPTTLEEYDDSPNKHQWKWTLSTSDLLSILCINLARELGIFSVLPVAFYQLNWSSVLDWDIVEVSQTARLSPTDERLFLRSQLRLLRLQSSTTMKWLSPQESTIPQELCEQRDICIHALENIAKQRREDLEMEAFVLDDWNTSWGEKLCSLCKMTAKSTFAEGRRQIFRQLPSIYELPDWEVLKKMDFE